MDFSEKTKVTKMFLFLPLTQNVVAERFRFCRVDTFAAIAFDSAIGTCYD